MDGHSFCRSLLKCSIEDYQNLSPDFRPSLLSTTKSTLGGYEVQGPDRFYFYANSACCVWSAKSEAIDSLIQSEIDSD